MTHPDYKKVLGDQTKRVGAEFLPVPPGEPIKGETLIADGWTYWDPAGKFSPEMWDYLLSIIGENNYRILIMSQGADWVRGQLMVSPEGMANLHAHKPAQSVP